MCKYVIYKTSEHKYGSDRYYTADFSEPSYYSNEPYGGWSSEIEHGVKYSKRKAKQLRNSMNGGVIQFNIRRFRY